MAKKFAAAINYIDGCVQKPVARYLQKSFDIDHVDMITGPGPGKILSEDTKVHAVEFLKKNVEISVKKHNSQIIAIVSHYDCTGSLENEHVQKEHLQKAANVILSWGFPVKKIIAL